MVVPRRPRRHRALPLSRHRDRRLLPRSGFIDDTRAFRRSRRVTTRRDEWTRRSSRDWSPRGGSRSPAPSASSTTSSTRSRGGCSSCDRPRGPRSPHPRSRQPGRAVAAGADRAPRPRRVPPRPSGLVHRAGDGCRGLGHRRLHRSVDPTLVDRLSRPGRPVHGRRARRGRRPRRGRAEHRRRVTPATTWPRSWRPSPTRMSRSSRSRSPRPATGSTATGGSTRTTPRCGTTSRCCAAGFAADARPVTRARARPRGARRPPPGRRSADRDRALRQHPRERSTCGRGAARVRRASRPRPRRVAARAASVSCRRRSTASRRESRDADLEAVRDATGLDRRRARRDRAVRRLGAERRLPRRAAGVGVGGCALRRRHRAVGAPQAVDAQRRSHPPRAARRGAAATRSCPRRSPIRQCSPPSSSSGTRMPATCPTSTSRPTAPRSSSGSATPGSSIASPDRRRLAHQAAAADRSGRPPGARRRTLGVRLRDRRRFVAGVDRERAVAATRGDRSACDVGHRRPRPRRRPSLDRTMPSRDRRWHPGGSPPAPARADICSPNTRDTPHHEGTHP